MGRGDQNAAKQQEAQQVALSNQIAQQSFQNQQGMLQNLTPKLNDLYTNAGYTPAEKAAAQHGVLTSNAAQFGAAEDQARDSAARTGNTTGMNATREQLARENAQQSAQSLDNLSQQEAAARMDQQNNVLRDMTGLYTGTSAPIASGLETGTSATNNFMNNAYKPGFWQQLALAAVGGAAQGASAGAAAGAAA